jgi:hypothetical protein
MTETSILPISSDNAEPPVGSQPPEDGNAAGANRRKLLIVGGAAGAVVVAVAAFLLLHGGSSPAPAAAPVPHGTFKAAAAPATHKSTGKSKAKTTTLPKKAKANPGRNPFIPLYTAPVTTGTAAGPTTTVSSAPSTGTGTTPVTTNPTPAPTSNNGLGNPTYIQLLTTKGTTQAKFQVGYPHHKFKRYNVDAPAPGSNSGTVFGSIFALLSVKNGIATVQVGDGAPFQLTTGISRTT